MPVQTLSPEQDYAAQILAREDLYFYSRYMFLKRKGYTWLKGMQHKVICDALMKVFRGEIRRLIINVPPRYSKTELAVNNFVSWSLGKVPDAEFILPSYAASLATNNSWQTREIVTHEAYRQIFTDVVIRGDAGAKHDWRTTKGGVVFATGIGGPCTGYGAGKMRDGFGGAIIIDDPHKADEARSDAARNGVITWYQETLASRINSPDTPIILIMQRLHERDLAGWLLDGGTGEEWVHINLPAIQHDEQGEPFALWPEKHDLARLLAMETASPYMFAGQMMQSPSAAEGNIFKPDRIEVIDALPSGRVKAVRGWDFAASMPEPGKDPDYTVGFKLLEYDDGTYVIADVARDRGGPDEVQKMLKNVTQADTRSVQVSIPQDPGQAGKAQVFALTKLLKGYRVSSSTETGDKITRAEPFAAQVNVGNVKMLRASWNEPLKEELRMFPNGAHDDIADAGSRAFNKLNETAKPLKVPAGLIKRVQNQGRVTR